MVAWYKKLIPKPSITNIVLPTTYIRDIISNETGGKSNETIQGGVIDVVSPVIDTVKDPVIDVATPIIDVVTPVAEGIGKFGARVGGKFLDLGENFLDALNKFLSGESLMWIAAIVVGGVVITKL